MGGDAWTPHGSPCATVATVVTCGAGLVDANALALVDGESSVVLPPAE